MIKYLKQHFQTIFLIIFVSLGIDIININQNSKLSSQIIGVQNLQGKTGGKINSQDCGYIANQPNHILNLMEKTDSLRVTLKANGGKPTLLILGPGDQDRFCVLGDTNSGVNPEISGVWEPGKYLIYIGDLTNSQYDFTLNISHQK
jgi:hypothetical protein